MSGMDGMNGMGGGEEEVRVEIGCHIDQEDKKVLVVRTGLADVRFEFSSEKDAILADKAASMIGVAAQTWQLLAKRVEEMKMWSPVGDGEKGGEG